MDIKMVVAALLSVAMGASQFVFAAEKKPRATLHKFAGLELGYGTYTFDKKIDGKLVFPVANLTAGLAYQRFSAAVNYSGSINDADVEEEELFGDASRKDIDLTLGYQLNKTIGLFVGYKDGQTDLTLKNRDSDIAGGDEYYQQSGPYVGINFNWAIPDAGKFAFSIAYAQLDADNKFISDGDGVEVGETLEFDDIEGKTSGDSDGYSYNLSWSMPIKGNLLFRARLRVNEYEQDITYQGITFRGIKESSSLLMVGVTTIF